MPALDAGAQPNCADGRLSPASPGAYRQELPGTALASQGALLVASPRRRVFPGQKVQVGHARRFVARALDGCPAADDAILLTSEVVANALLYTRSAGGTFEVLVWRGLGAACVAVVDGGADIEPASRRAEELAESGHGLELVEALAARWGYCGGPAGRVVWFALRWLSLG
jgi:anti-sigma regulatory factor (Ser/Thr protein kinase)